MKLVFTSIKLKMSNSIIKSLSFYKLCIFAKQLNYLCKELAIKADIFKIIYTDFIRPVLLTKHA